MYYLLYVIFFLSVLLYGSVYIGPVTPRQFMTIVMFIYLFMNKKLFLDRILKLYICFIFCYILSNTLTGFFSSSLKFVFSFFLVAIIGYIATANLFRKKNGYSFLMYTIIIIGCFNSLVTIFQLLRINALDPLLNILNLKTGFNAFTDGASNYSIADNNVFIFALPGIFLDAVSNGYFSAVAAICSLYLPYVRNKLISYIPWLFLMGGCFATQQRTSLIGAFICSLLIFYYMFRYDSLHGKSLSRLFPVFILSIILIILSSISFTMETRFDDLTNMESRTDLYNDSIEFISDNIFFGGINLFFSKYHEYPHNFFFNSFIAGGLIGAFFIFVIIFIQFRSSIRLLRKIKTTHVLIPLLALLSMFGASLMHNQSIVYGDFLYLCFSSFLVNGLIHSKLE